MSETEEKLDYKKIINDYLPTEEDDDYMLSLKNKVLQDLTEPEKRVFLLYAELGSYSAVGRQLKCSPPTVRKYIDIIREKLID